jgi:chromosome segregation ATPase
MKHLQEELSSSKEQQQISDDTVCSLRSELQRAHEAVERLLPNQLLLQQEHGSLRCRERELEEEVGALKQSNKHVTIELEKSIKVAKEFESRFHEDEVRYNDASQALTNWKRTAQELGKQVCTQNLCPDFSALFVIIFCRLQTFETNSAS